MSEIKEILEGLGYTLKDCGNEWRCRPLYRDSKNDTSLKINKGGSWFDFSACIGGTLADLIKLTLNLTSIDEATKWLQDKHKFVPIITEDKPKLEVPRKFPLKLLDELIPSYSYWVKRGIPAEIVRQFRGGYSPKGQMKYRYVFPIFNVRGEIIGFSGRSIDNREPKWLHKGARTNWVWPAFLNNKEIFQKKEIILVESIGCVLSLWRDGIRNVLSLFGVSMSFPLINFCLKVDPKRIIIATNNEESGVGNTAALKIEKKLLRYFDREQVLIHLPERKDFGSQICQENIDWYRKLNV